MLAYDSSVGPQGLDISTRAQVGAAGNQGVPGAQPKPHWAQTNHLAPRAKRLSTTELESSTLVVGYPFPAPWGCVKLLVA